MKVLLFIFFLSTTSIGQDAGAIPSKAATPAKITNKDILLMHQAGLNDQVISEKIPGSTCDFDTSPTALAELKPAGISDAVVLEMIHCESRGSANENPSAANEPAKVAQPADLKAYTISFVKSDRKRKYGFRSEPYDKISDYLQIKLVEALKQHGLQQSPSLNRDCCLLTIELLEVTSHPAMIKKPGVDVTANLAITDSGKRILYSKGYRGESRTAMNTWGHLINHAVEEMVRDMANDENLTHVLGTGKL